MKYRTKTEIMSEILGIANGSTATKTMIMYRAFLSYRQMKKHLMVLTQSNLLNYDAYTQTFKTTEKGLRFLHTCNKMDGVAKAIASSLQQQRQV
jgi:predicted transcriptional regulator